MEIKDNVALVTGGASGLGRAAVEHIVANGGKAAIVDINEEKANDAQIGDCTEPGYVYWLVQYFDQNIGRQYQAEYGSRGQDGHDESRVA